MGQTDLVRVDPVDIVAIQLVSRRFIGTADIEDIVSLRTEELAASINPRVESSNRWATAFLGWSKDYAGQREG